MSQTPPISAKGSVARIRSASSVLRKVRNNNTKITAMVTGTTIFNLSLARCRYSNCPDHEIE